MLKHRVQRHNAKNNAPKLHSKSHETIRTCIDHFTRALCCVWGHVLAMGALMHANCTLDRVAF